MGVPKSPDRASPKAHLSLGVGGAGLQEMVGAGLRHPSPSLDGWAGRHPVRRARPLPLCMAWSATGVFQLSLPTGIISGVLCTLLTMARNGLGVLVWGGKRLGLREDGGPTHLGEVLDAAFTFSITLGLEWGIFGFLDA